MKHNYLVLVIIAVLMMFAACETQHYDSQSSSSGTTVIALVWKGESAAAPDNPKTNWAYYNTTEKRRISSTAQTGRYLHRTVRILLPLYLLRHIR